MSDPVRPKRETDKDRSNPANPPRNPPSSPPQQQPPPSLTSRIQSSAAGLARNALSSSSADTHLLPANTNGNTNTAKASRSGASSALSAAQQYTHETSSSSSAAHASSSTTTPGPSFRSNTHHPDTLTLPALTPSEFEHTPIDLTDPTPVPVANPTPPTAKGKGKQRATTTPPPPLQISTPAPNDGAEVVTLLNSPTFSPEFPGEVDPPETDLSETLTAAELQTLASFRRDPPPRLTSLSLVPDIDSILDSAATPASDATALRDAVIAGLPGAADWVAVEERYHDEVWGYLRPTLEAARKEMDEGTRGPDGGAEGPAVRRLRMVLKHMQG
ncbi:hypothetical protein BDV59DRAFT_118737 [Aspergillus ambiguus]|uniref:uncharacterized protein n=1 Tax=Aspergillus ambiguus TaxID=176160 RepID=UPI003CCD6AA2